MGFTPPLSSSTLTFILCKARFSNFCWLYLSTSSFFRYLWSLMVPSCWSICIFFAIIDLVLPFLGSVRTRFREGDVPKILFLINFFYLIKFPFSPSMSDSKNINRPFILPWSNNFSIKKRILSRASSLALDLTVSYDWNNLGYWMQKK